MQPSGKLSWGGKVWLQKLTRHRAQPGSAAYQLHRLSWLTQLPVSTSINRDDIHKLSFAPILSSDCLPSCETQECTTFWVHTDPQHLLLFLQSCLQPHCHQSCSTLTPVKLGMVPRLTLLPTLAVLSQAATWPEKHHLQDLSCTHILLSESPSSYLPTYTLTLLGDVKLPETLPSGKHFHTSPTWGHSLSLCSKSWYYKFTQQISQPYHM